MTDLNPSWDVICADRDSCELICGRSMPLPMKKWRDVHVADWFRLQCLAEHGGVWLDASVLCLQPLEAWVDMREDTALQAFDAPIRRAGIMENWALACAPGCAFARALAEEMQVCATVGHTEYRASLPSHAFFGKGARAYDSPYFLTHQIAQKLRHERADPLVLYRGVLPFAYDLAVILACLRGSTDHQAPFIKICHIWQKLVDSELKKNEDVQSQLGLGIGQPQRLGSSM